MAYNQLGGIGIKSIVRSNPQSVTTAGASGGTGTSSDPYYIDITITEVSDLNKTLINASLLYNGSAGIAGYCKLTSTTNLRVYYLFNNSLYYEIIETY